MNIQIEKLHLNDAEKARKFCLQTIKEAFGYDYTPAWHIDLDNLNKASHDYTEDNNGMFYVVKVEGEIIGAAGLRSLTTKKNMVEQFKNRYPNPEIIGSYWRFYINPKYRRQGIGSQLVKKIEEDARSFGYISIYLHTSNMQPNAVKFWQKQGFIIFLEENDSVDQIVHMDKKL